MINYPAEFKEKVKGVYPNMVDLHRCLEDGEELAICVIFSHAMLACVSADNSPEMMAANQERIQLFHDLMFFLHEGK